MALEDMMAQDQMEASCLSYTSLQGPGRGLNAFLDAEVPQKSRGANMERRKCERISRTG